MVFNIGSLGRVIGVATLVLAASPASAQSFFDLFQPPKPQQPAPQVQPPQRAQPVPPRQHQSAPQRTQPPAQKAAAPAANVPYGEVRSACQAEIKATCAGVVPGSADSVQCLKRNFAVHSPACQAALSRAHAPAAQPDAATTAKPTEPAGTAAEPRRVSTDRVTPPAAADEPLKMAPATKMRPTQEARFVSRYCREDHSLLCQGVSFGHGRVLTCLAGQQSSLTNECKKALTSRR